ncbi:MAG: Gfo/Idh/MocA family oxidoreductase [Alphaproteobacteria bacterium]|nr:Gfo/Idh/MocA family oxidoreductase [Alphaproteobacteria bacterium]MDE2014019.1 Gfo/Idh/MocA family oxidoreductase [Alphaproteobacteria bacterium]MDE2074520.1 Gfo/Idh/MocA family oxidoreductase [Alphaproteobacteria bacterium]MDE2353240.1 Gfo/Idh/MocA family oxidoreductase [Alphaproteobacteria bacterium]
MRSNPTSLSTSGLRAAVVGAGAFGRHHATKYADMDGVRLVAIADPSVEARAAAMAKFGVPTVADWRDLLGKVDVVSVCSPAVTHAAIVRGFLEAGVHVLVEKPIATTLSEADALIALAEEKDLVLTVGHQERFVFAHSGLLDFVDAPLAIECWRAGPWTGRGADVSSVLDLMIHDLDLVHRLIPGAVTDVQAEGRATHGRLADEVSAVVQFENGTQARLLSSRISDERRRGLRAVYPDGVIEIDFVTRQVKNTTRRPLCAPDLADPLGASVAAFVAAARSGAMTLVRPEEARRALETALLIDEAATPRTQIRAGKEVALQA